MERIHKLTIIITITMMNLSNHILLKKVKVQDDLN